MAQLATTLKRFGLSDRLIRRNPFYYGRALRLLREFESLPPAEREAWRHRRTERVLAAARSTAYGRRVGAPSSLAQWPLLEKPALRDRPGDFLARHAFLSVSAATSGTTGMPLQLRRSFECVAYEQAVIDHLLEIGGSNRHCRAAVLRGDDIKDPRDREPPFWRITNGGRRIVFSSNHLDESTLPHFLAALRDYAPEVIFAYPTVLESLCSLMLAHGEELHVPLTMCGSEVLTPATSEIARRALHTRVVAWYGQAERVAWAQGNPEDGFRFVGSYSMNELKRVESPDDRPVDGTETYELIGTGLWNEAMPLVRYRTGDQVRLRKGSDPSAVAAGLESFHSVIGRSGDYLVAPSGARLMGIDHIPRNVPHLVRTQFIQESADSITLLVVPAPGFNEECRRLLLQHAALKLPPSMKVRIETTTQLVRNASGKAPLVVRQV
jgi:phenylacetate-CoA ligase